MKLGLMFALLIFSSQSISDQGSNDMLHLYTVLTGCSNIPPNGYIVSSVSPGSSNKNCGGGAVGGYLGYYTYDSYFDKPVGAQMQMCEGVYSIPDGWYQVNVVKTLNCFQGQSQALVIQRYS